jgi:hypothetical protein
MYIGLDCINTNCILFSCVLHVLSIVSTFSLGTWGSRGIIFLRLKNFFGGRFTYKLV